jgi:hypothetical protein
MVREWTAPQRTFLVEKKLLGAELAQIAAEYAPLLQTFECSFIIYRMLHQDILPEIQAVLGPRRWNRCIFQQV